MTKERLKHSSLYYLTAAVWIAALVILDQKIKQLAAAALKGNDGTELIPGILRLRYIENRGMAFGLLQDARVFFIVVTVAVLIGLAVLLHMIPEKKRFLPLSTGVTFMIAGAIGNFIDRVKDGFVVDYLDLAFMDFPVFNLADCFLTWTAVVLALLVAFFYSNEDLKQIRL